MDVRLPPGYRLIHFREIDSTNAEALRRAAEGERGPLWLWADRQLEGRGRLGRSWESEPGNLYATLLISFSSTPKAAASLSVMVPLAVLKTFEGLLPAGARLELKWPNDVLLEGRKAAGILVESTLQKNSMPVAIGCGLNLRHAPEQTRYGATTLAEHGASVSPQAALEALAAQLDRYLKIWSDGEGFAALKASWLHYAKGLGQAITINLSGEAAAGLFEGLANDGGLLLRSGEGVRVFHAGEVSLADFAEGGS
jgi:BirA family biotin operon repressor/biotin-[acetyl-CoA-carboxylase] ligase